MRLIKRFVAFLISEILGGWQILFNFTGNMLRKNNIMMGQLVTQDGRQHRTCGMVGTGNF